MFPCYEIEFSTLKHIHENIHEFDHFDVLRVKGFCLIPQHHGHELVQVSGSRPESAREVCGSSPQNCRDTWLSHKTKTGGSACGYGIRARREASMPEDTRRDHGACVGGTQTAVRAWPPDEERSLLDHLHQTSCDFMWRLPDAPLPQSVDHIRLLIQSPQEDVASAILHVSGRSISVSYAFQEEGDQVHDVQRLVPGGCGRLQEDAVRYNM
jgi:hypothetical protein